jgi:hypothetical protein
MIRLRKLGKAHPHTIKTKNKMEAAYQNSGLPEPFDEWLRKNFG